ncbi:hypothetical protein BpHYR1_015119 [Brachionus plicatilis]|uniref:Uncharacterized protein n=1 Tax=Brachionus plicatilis TaxID=10195 RepID=A0A3M7SA96_BRAPC|nr:hypothetical protein BpHYR1_015119 [Brachionus plicatilis]
METFKYDLIFVFELQNVSNVEITLKKCDVSDIYFNFKTKKKQYDKKLNVNEFKAGDLVLLTNTRQTVGQVCSFNPKFLGPY